MVNPKSFLTEASLIAASFAVFLFIKNVYVICTYDEIM